MSLARIRLLEVVAVIFSLLYTVLLTYGIIWCWLFALLSAIMYLYICYQKRIYAESLLQLFYVFTAGYGYQNWGEGLGGKLPELSTLGHVLISISGFGLVAVSGYYLKRFSDAATPFIDSFTTVFSIFATLLMINLYPSNWIYWIIIDSVSVYLYFRRELYITSGLFLLYTALAVNGYFEWVN